ncbi:MAG: polysaccharide biosynthesis/export family protein [Terracidiphilus sp.]|jgi:polysaccharide export outer membrane protein
MRYGSLFFAACLGLALSCGAQEKSTADQAVAQPDASTPDALSAVGSLFHKQKPKPAATAATDTPTAKASAPPTAATSDGGIYVIGPSDVIAVTVFKEPTLSNTLLVRPDGMISIPLLGDVEASGKTPGQLAEEITTKLKKYIQDPNVTVLLSGMNSKKVYMMGEVAKIGPVDLIPGMTLLQAIASAGGLTVYANSGKIYILRNEGGQQQKIPVQYKLALKGDSALNLTLKAGDTIVVP